MPVGRPRGPPLPRPDQRHFNNHFNNQWQSQDSVINNVYPNNSQYEDHLENERRLSQMLPSKQFDAGLTVRLKSIRRRDIRTLGRNNRTLGRRYQQVGQPSSNEYQPEEGLNQFSDNNAEVIIEDEETAWEQINNIKTKTIPMRDKRREKQTILGGQNAQLSGFQQFKWKRKRMFFKLKARVSDNLSKLELWRSQIKELEGNYGSGVVAYFLLIKWILFLNLCLFAFIVGFLVIPTIISNEEVSVEATDDCSSEYLNYTRTNKEKNVVLDVFQGTGFMELTLMFYGYYPSQTFYYQNTGAKYNLPLAYILVPLFFLILSLMAIVRTAVKGFKERLITNEGKLHKYGNMIFAAWDFCINNETSAERKHKLIFNVIKSTLESEEFERKRKQRMGNHKKIIAIRTFIHMIVLSILAGCAYAIYKIFDYCTNRKGNNDFETFFFEFLPSIAIVVLNILIPMIFQYLIIVECYKPINIVRITLIRTVLLRLSSLIVLLGTLYSQIVCDQTDQTCHHYDNCKTCWETYVGQQIYKLVLTNFATQLFITFVVNFPRALIARRFIDNKFIQLICGQTFDLPRHVLDVVYAQTLCWLGFFYAPIISGLSIVFTFIMFYIKKFTCTVNSKPSPASHKVSRSNSMFMIILLISYIVAVAPVAYSVSELPPSKSCGPFRNLSSIWSIVTDSFEDSPSFVRTIVSFIGTAGFALPVFMILIILLYYYSAKHAANQHMVTVLKNQLAIEAKDKKFLMNRYNEFLKKRTSDASKLFT